MPSYSIPLIDDQNPLYCPAVSPSSYLKFLRGRQYGNSDNFLRPNQRILYRSFARILTQSLQAQEQMITGSTGRQKDHSLRAYLPPLWENDEESTLTVCGSSDCLNATLPMRNTLPSRLTKRKRSLDSLESFTDLQGPSKYARSCPSVHDSSFEVGLTRDTLQYSQLMSSPVVLATDPDMAPEVTLTATGELKARIRVLEDELHGPPLGTETPRGIKPFIDRLDVLIPGIRLKERIYALPDLSHQGIADFLGNKGLLNSRILDAFRTSEIRFLSLDKSLAYENGLNMDCYDSITVFGKPNSFLFLSELSISGTPFRDIDLVHIHHLPRLASLTLEDASISNEAVFLLTTLKRTLTFLSLSRNPAIDDDAVPALLILFKLEYLCIVDTGIRMPGLRRFASAILEEDRRLRIDSPAQCEKYITRLHTQYLLNPAPPLIVAPELCGQLSVAALKRNLAAHAIANPTIFAGGSKQEMTMRLRELLERRRLDFLARDLILSIDEDMSEEDVEGKR